MADALLPSLRVVEIGQYVAAPFAATLLADQGAEVVKIERPGGDPYRRYPGRWAAWNRGKTSVVLDLATGPGRDAALELIDGADVVVENLRPGALGRLGVPLDELRARTTGLRRRGRCRIAPPLRNSSASNSEVSTCCP